MNVNKYYQQLIGFQITGFRMNDDDFDPFPCFTMKRGDEVIEVEVSRDPEGNGGGFLFIGEAK